MIWRIPLFLVLVFYGAWCAVTVGMWNDTPGPTTTQEMTGFPWPLIAFFFILALVYNLYVFVSTKIILNSGRITENDRQILREEGWLHSEISAASAYEGQATGSWNYVWGAQWFGFLILLALSLVDVISVPLGAPGFNEATGALLGFLVQVL